jgi:hypothetical protein
LRALHALAEHEDVLGQQPLVEGIGKIELAPQVARNPGDELILAHDGRHVLEHRLALVRVDAQGGDHVEKRIGVDILLMGVAAEHELQLRSGHEFADDVLDVVAHDALGRRKVPDAHPDDPPIDVG